MKREKNSSQICGSLHSNGKGRKWKSDLRRNFEWKFVSAIVNYLSSKWTEIVCTKCSWPNKTIFFFITFICIISKWTWAHIIFFLYRSMKQRFGAPIFIQLLFSRTIKNICIVRCYRHFPCLVLLDIRLILYSSRRIHHYFSSCSFVCEYFHYGVFV